LIDHKFNSEREERPINGSFAWRMICSLISVPGPQYPEGASDMSYPEIAAHAIARTWIEKDEATFASWMKWQHYGNTY